MTTSARPVILLTGATGYVGGRLLTALEARGERVRCMARRPAHLLSRVADTTEVVKGDVLDAETLSSALEGVHTAYYLVHSMGSTGSFVDLEAQGAHAFAAAARRAGVQRIIYLGGLGAGELSDHLESRQEVGRILRASGLPTVELRASIILGSGSLSFEMIRALVEKLPVMITPRWVSTLAQPIAIEDVIAYLVGALDLAHGGSHVVEIGGTDRASYGDIMQEYAHQRGLKRAMVPVPVLTPKLSGLWLGLVTPLYARVGRKLITSLTNETVVQDPATAAHLFPAIQPRGLTAAIARALAKEDHEIAQTRWSDALSAAGAPRTWGGVRFGSRLVDSRTVRVNASAQAAFAPIAQIGGARGWYYGDWLWRARGLLDLFVGGVGMRRGRRHPSELAVGDAIDFWRVESFAPGRLLRLRAEMKLPGRAWLELQVEPDGAGAVIRQTAVFDPVGLAGKAYWYGIYPLHEIVFRGMLRRLAAAAESGAERHVAPPAEPAPAEPFERARWRADTLRVVGGRHAHEARAEETR